ncbi:DUF6978 family protein [Aerococcaceae bacterium WGS1372]
MKEIRINDNEAERLTFMLKHIIEDVEGTLNYGDKGEINIKGSGNYPFVLSYYYDINKKSFNFRETKYNYSLIRININKGFHKNADGEKVEGNRINIFSEEEYYAKADGTTHMRAYPLPYKSIQSVDDFIVLLHELLSYTNTNSTDKVKINTQITLDDVYL